MSDIELQYLLEYLQDEFKAFDEVRIRVPPFADEDDVGVSLKTESREYFFPVRWVETRQMDLVEKEVRRIKDVLEK